MIIPLQFFLRALLLYRLFFAVHLQLHCSCILLNKTIFATDSKIVYRSLEQSKRLSLTVPFTNTEHRTHGREKYSQNGIYHLLAQRFVRLVVRPWNVCQPFFRWPVCCRHCCRCFFITLPFYCHYKMYILLHCMCFFFYRCHNRTI